MKTTKFSLIAAITLVATLASCDKEAYIDVPMASNPESSSVATDPNTLNGHEYVDLGLSVKWATCNVDAQHPEDFGGYYAWGDDKPYSHVAHFLDSLGFKKEFFLTNNKGYIDHLSDRLRLDAVGRGLILKGIDIATYKWGEGWRLPTKNEFVELYDNCIWQDVIVDDIVCYKVTSKIPGYTDCYIIIPHTGYNFVDTEADIYEDAVYWTGTLRSDYWIHLFVFNSKEYTDCFSGAAVGYPVRPVCK